MEIKIIMKKLNLKVALAGVLAVTTMVAPLTGTIAEVSPDFMLMLTSEKINNQASKVGYATVGTVVDYLGTTGNWYKVSTNGTVGYSHINYWNGYTATALNNVNVRSTPSNTGTKVGYAAAGTEATLLGHG